ncbi:MAG: Tm-1-like ATP-binding domain-containing protein, partial [Anaerolineales bacterium]
MSRKIVIIGTLDTKGAEIAYLRDRLQALDLETIVVDSGILGEPIGIALDPERDISRAKAARYGDHTIEELRDAGSRGKPVEGMRAALKQLLDGVTTVARRLGPADIALRIQCDADGFAQDPGIDHNGLQIQRFKPLAQIGNLRTFGVQRADDDNLLTHRTFLRLDGKRPCTLP